MLRELENMKQLYICCGYVDMRKGIEGLAAVVQIKYGKQIEEGSLFLFCGRRADRFKGLFWDSNGCITKFLTEFPKDFYPKRQLFSGYFRFYLK